MQPSEVGGKSEEVEAAIRILGSLEAAARPGWKACDAAEVLRLLRQVCRVDLLADGDLLARNGALCDAVVSALSAVIKDMFCGDEVSGKLDSAMELWLKVLAKNFSLRHSPHKLDTYIHVCRLLMTLPPTPFPAPLRFASRLQRRIKGCAVHWAARSSRGWAPTLSTRSGCGRRRVPRLSGGAWCWISRAGPRRCSSGPSSSRRYSGTWNASKASAQTLRMWGRRAAHSLEPPAICITCLVDVFILILLLIHVCLACPAALLLLDMLVSVYQQLKSSYRIFMDFAVKSAETSPPVSNTPISHLLSHPLLSQKLSLCRIPRP